MRFGLQGASKNWNRWDNEFVEKQTDSIELNKYLNLLFAEVRQI